MIKNIIFVLFLSCYLINNVDNAHALQTVYVNNTYTSTSTEGKVLGVDVFTTIQEAVNAVDEGGTVYVTTGIYNESILITKSLSLLGGRPLVKVGAHPNTAVINGGTSTGAIIIDGADSPIKVLIRNLMITRGSYGIAVLHNANVTLTRNTITHYAKNGITFGPVFLPEAGGISGTISRNIITGIGPTNTLAQNGIQVSEDNTAIISDNKISNNIYTIDGTKWATGILVHQSKGLLISNNTLIDNQIGINLIKTSASTVTGNTVTGNKLSKAGIMVSNPDTDMTYTSTGNTIKRNTLSGGFIGIWSSYAHGNKYLNNIVSSSMRNGIYLWNSNDNILTSNTISSVRSFKKDVQSVGVELDEDQDAISETSKGSRFNTLVDNVVVKSDSGFLLAKNSKNNNFANNRFNGTFTSPVEELSKEKIEN